MLRADAIDPATCNRFAQLDPERGTERTPNRCPRDHRNTDACGRDARSEVWSLCIRLLSQIGATISSVVFGYMVRSTGSYNIALIPVVGMIALCAILCLRIDATEQLFPESIPGVPTVHSTPTP